MTRKFMVCSLIATCLVSFGPEAAATEKRVMKPDDLFHLQTLNSVAISSDGELVAYEVQRPMAAESTFGREHMWGDDRGDIWIASVNRKRLSNITNGSSDDSGFWAPLWSPDGEWLAMFSSRGGNVRIWIWQKSSGRLRPLSDRGVNPWSDSLTWTSDHQLVYAALALGEESPLMSLDTKARGSLLNEWARQKNGRDATASTLESGIPVSVEDRPGQELRLADVSTGQTRVLCRAPSFATVRVSPDRRWIAFLEQMGVWQPVPEQRVTELDTEIFRTTVVSAEVASTPHAMSGAAEVFAGSLVWSPDSTELAMVGYDRTSSPREQVFRCNVRKAGCKAATESPLTLNLFARNRVRQPPYLWYGEDSLLIYGGKRESRESPSEQPELRWWAADADGHVRDFFARITGKNATPTDVVADPVQNGVVAIIEGKAWRVAHDGALVDNLTLNLGTRIISVERGPLLEYPDGEKMVLSSQGARQDNLYLLDLRLEQIHTIPKPSPAAMLAAFDRRRQTFVFTANDATGTYLWLKQLDQDGFKTLSETNQFLREVEPGKLGQIEYRSLQGEQLKGWVILPPGLREGQRYPVIVWVYPGQRYGDEQPFLAAINNCHPLNLQLLAAHGYVVLMPSMPLEPYGNVGDPYMELMNGSLPAVDKLIDSGIVDSSRVGVIGHSYGGLGVYGLITETTRFKAAAALAGPTNLVSMYGIFDPLLRYSSFAHEDPFRMWDAETSSMGGPPWKDQQRYLRNSPITYAERVSTPLLIIQGDLDFVPLQQGEEFFTALYRQNKRAEFVRYWGEGHMLTSPANIRDMWRKIYVWFDQFLQVGDPAPSE